MLLKFKVFFLVCIFLLILLEAEVEGNHGFLNLSISIYL